MEETLAMREVEARTRPPRHPYQHEQPRRGVYAEPASSTGRLPLMEETLALQKAKLGPDHPDTLTTMINLAVGYQYAGRLDRALPLFEETLATSEVEARSRPPRHSQVHEQPRRAPTRLPGSSTARCPSWRKRSRSGRRSSDPTTPKPLTRMSDLARRYGDAGKLDRAPLPLYEETLAIQKSKLGPDHPDTLRSMNNLAVGYLLARKPDRALPLMEKTLALRKSKLGPDHPNTLSAIINLASAYRDGGKLDRALPLYEETLAIQKSKLGPDHPDTLSTMSNLANACRDAGKLNRSILLLEECLKLRRVKSGEDHPVTMLVKANLGVNYKDADRLAEALTLLEEANRAVPKYPRLRWVRGQLLDTYIKAGRNDEAAGLAKEMLAKERAAFPAGSPQLAGMLAQVGGSLLRLKHWVEAEPVVARP